jgi:hypothetical protein
METIEELAEKMYPINSTGGVMEILNKHQLNNSYKQEGFIDGAKSNAAKDYWYSQFQEQDKKFYSEEDFKNCYFSAIKSTGEGWNGEYAKGNSPCIEEMFGESFQDWYLQFKKQNNEQ